MKSAARLLCLLATAAALTGCVETRFESADLRLDVARFAL